jgi:septation ring formation regulator EzrA
MQSLTYQDIIDDKIAEWQNGLQKLEDQAAKAHSDTQAQLKAKMEKLKAAIDSAKVQLHKLDVQETVDNTMETKDKILKIFSSIDKDFTGFEDETPFML